MKLEIKEAAKKEVLLKNIQSNEAFIWENTYFICTYANNKEVRAICLGTEISPEFISYTFSDYYFKDTVIEVNIDWDNTKITLALK